jgi:outer membrane murein-binding lipoprotein Lpp
MIPKLRLPSGILRVASVVAVLVALFGASFYFQQQSEHAAANQTRGLEDRIEQLTKEFKFSQQAIQVAPDKAAQDIERLRAKIELLRQQIQKLTEQLSQKPADKQ